MTVHDSGLDGRTPGLRGEVVRIALCVDSLELPAWVRELISRLMNSADVAITLLVETGSRTPAPLPSLGFGRHFLYTILRIFEQRVFRPARNAFAPGDASSMFAHVPRVHIDPASVTSENVRAVMDHAPDILLTFSSRPLPDSLISLPPFGVWSYKTRFQLSNPQFLSGFWEVLEGNPVTNNALYRLAAGPAVDVVVYQSASATDKSFVMRNMNNTTWKAMHFVERALRGSFTRGEEGSAPVAEHVALKDPTNQVLLIPLLAHLGRMVIRRVRSFFYRHRWVLFCQSTESGNALKPVLPPGNRVWADPHIFVKGGQYHVFIEEIPEGSRRGHISVLDMKDGGRVSGARTILQRPYHLSYPFVFEWQGEVYMIPQSTGQQAIELYRCVSFPGSWEFDKFLVKDVDAVDTTLVLKDRRWWMFTCTRDNAGYSPSEELSIFHADSPVSDNWTPHRRNPVVSDVCRARPAGAFIERDGLLYRPSQDCSVRYGYATRMNRVEVLNEEEYVEREVGFLEPGWDPRVKGVHSIAVNGSLTIIDALLEQPRFFRPRTWPDQR